MSKKPRGALRHVLKLQGFTLVTDGKGGTTVMWQEPEECPVVYAAIDDIAVTRGVEAGALKTRTRHKITIAYRTDVREDMRLLGDNAVYIVESVLDVGHRKEYLEIQVRSE